VRDLLENVRIVLGRARALPVLFVGSGFSRRYIHSPDWIGLLSTFADKAGHPLPYYRGLAGDDLPKIASLIADDFYESWWSSAEYADSVKEFGDSVGVKSDPLKFEISKYILSMQLSESTQEFHELSLLSRTHIHAAITTNWDSVLDMHLDDFEVYVGQQKVLFSTSQAVGEVYKIHGCASDPRSLVLTSEDYKQYWDRNPYLIAKVLTLFVEHPIIFIGYSLRDPHIQQLLANLIACLDDSQIATLNDRVIFIERATTDRPESFIPGSLTVGAHTLDIHRLVLADYGELYQLLSELPQHLPAKLIRRFSEDIYQLAYSGDPGSRIRVLPITDDDDLEKIEVVIGVGAVARLGDKGYAPVTRRDLFLDMLNDARDHDPDSLMALVPRLFQLASYAPIFYALEVCDKLDANGHLRVDIDLPIKARKLVDGTGAPKPYPSRELSRRSKQSFRAILAEDKALVLRYALACQYDIDDVVALRVHLLELLETPKLSTEVAKLCCVYDGLVYGSSFTGDRQELRAAIGAARAATT